MKTYQKIWTISLILILVFLGTLALLRSGLFFSPEKKIDGIEEAAESFDAFTLPKDVRVIGIGEATHGNREFQIVKQEIFEKMIENGNGRAISFEMSVGEGAMINDAIHENETDLTELMGQNNYPLYDTKEIVDLLTYMREFNRTVPYEQSLMFYGVDMQGSETALAYLQSLCQKGSTHFTKEETDTLLSYDTQEVDLEIAAAFIEALDKRLSESSDPEERYLSTLTGVILQAVGAPDYEKEPAGYGDYRDNCMAQNLKRYSDLEAERGYDQILITAHNGHVMKGTSEASNGGDELAMGERIDQLFEGSYFCIGTEFYHTCVNIHTAGTYDETYERANHTYCSDDPLAYQAQYFDGGRYCLDFTRITDPDSRIYQLIHRPLFTGMIGEGYSRLNDLSKLERIRLVPTQRYDAMIFYYETTPIDPIHS